MDYVLGLSGFVFGGFCGVEGGSWPRGDCCSGGEPGDISLSFSGHLRDKVSLHLSLFFSSSLCFRCLPHTFTLGKVFIVSQAFPNLRWEVDGYLESPEEVKEDIAGLDWQGCVEELPTIPVEDKSQCLREHWSTFHLLAGTLRFRIKKAHGCTRYRGQECK